MTTLARRWRRHGAYVAGLSPATLLLALFFVAPAFWAIYASLTNVALTDIGAADPAFVGLDNYRDLWDNPDFRSLILRNTLVFVVGSAVIGQFGLGLALALLLDHAQRRGYRLASLAYGAVLLAWVSPAVVTGFVWARLLQYDLFGNQNGAFNVVLDALGLQTVDWLGRSPMLFVVLADVWRGTAFAMLIFFGALRTLPGEVHEAAQVDGAGAWRRFRDQTLPMLRTTAALVLLTTTIATSGAFLLIEVLTRGGPGFYQTETIALFAYHRAIVAGEIGYGSTIAVVLLALNLAFALVYLRVARSQV